MVKHNISHRFGGFTLIEVMVALVIVSLGMLAVIQAVSQTASNTTYIREKALAHWVAMNRITELRLAPKPPPTGETSGEVDMAGERWRWQATVSKTDVGSMSRIDVSVARIGEGLDDHQLETITGFYGEKIAQPGAVFAQFDAPPAVNTQGQPNTPNNPANPTNPVSPVKPPPPPDGAVQ